MTKSKSTKRALLMSVLSLVLCMVMLIGTTFAWFTDSVSSVNNIIKAGNLDVELEYWDGEWKTVNSNTNLFTGELWEPGHTEVIYLKVVNKGTLALKYQLGINIFSETGSVNQEGKPFMLSNYIYFGVEDGMEPEYESRVAAREAIEGSSKLIKEGYSKSSEMVSKAEEYIAMVVYMPETVGNEANYKTGEEAPEIRLGVNLLATQMEYENDSFGPDYDENAVYKLIYTFDNEGDLTAFDPVYFNPQNTAGSGMSVENGVAVVNKAGAFFFMDADVTKSQYTVEYDVDASKLANGESIIFNAGETSTWENNNVVSIKNDGTLKIAVGTARNNEETHQNLLAWTEIGANIHVTTTFAVNDEGKWVTTTTVSDGENTYTADSKVRNVPAGEYKLFWDIEDLSAAEGNVSIDNFTFYAKGNENIVKTFDELKKAIADGGHIVLGANIEVPEMVEIPVNGSASIDGKGYTLTRADSYTGTILSLGEYAELELSNITLDGENVESTGNLIYIDSFGKLILNDGAVLENHVGGTTYDSARGPENSVIHCDGETTIVMNEGSVIRNNVAKGGFATVIASMYYLTCELNGGKIVNNTSEKNNYTVNFGNYADITVSDGFEMSGNTDGGLIRLNQQTTFTMNGGKLDGNGKSAIYTWVAKYVTLNGGEIVGNVSLNYTPATVGGTDVDGVIYKDNEVTKWAMNLTPDFGTVRYSIAGNITQLNIVPAEGYTYAAGDENKLICENAGYETYWDAESGCFKVMKTA